MALEGWTRGRTPVLADIARLLEDAVVESEWLDYKADPALWPDPRVMPVVKLQALIAKAVSAFGNRGGGVLLLGMDEGPNGEPVAPPKPGLPAQLDGMPVVERVDRMITKCVRPRPITRIHLVPSNEPERPYVVVDVLARAGGPHRVVSTDDPSLDERYFVRLGRSSVVADHYQLRDLFASATEGTMRVREYLTRHGYGDPESSAFLRRPPVGQLARRTAPRDRAIGQVAITVIPRVLRGEIVETEVIDTDSELVKQLLDTAGNMAFGHDVHPTLDGIAVDEQAEPPLLRSFLHVHRNGMIEAGHSQAFADTDNGNFVLAHAIHAMVVPMLLFAKGVYGAADIADDVLIGIHLRGCKSARLGTVTRGTVTGTGRSDLDALSIEITARQDELESPRLHAQLDRRLAHAFGVREGLVLTADGSRRPESMYV